MMHVLLVEDNDIDAFIADHMLLSVCENCKVTRFTNGKDALDYLKLGDYISPIVIILDINMPVMNGVQFLQEIDCDEQLRKLKITVLSSSTNAGDIAHCQNFGISRYYEKPLTIDTSKEIMTYGAA